MTENEQVVQEPESAVQEPEEESAAQVQEPPVAPFKGDMWFHYRQNHPASYEVVNLDYIGLEGAWVRFRRMGTFTSHELRELDDYWRQRRTQYLHARVEEEAAKFIAQQRAKPESLKDLDDSIDLLSALGMDTAQLDETERARLNALLSNAAIQHHTAISGIDIEMIDEWNLTDPYTGDPLPVPKDDFTVLDRLPVMVVMAIRTELARISEESVAPPKESSQSTTGA